MGFLAQGKGTLFVIECKTGPVLMVAAQDSRTIGREISRWSAIPSEEEVLFRSNCMFNIKPITPAGKKLIEEATQTNLANVQVFELTEFIPKSCFVFDRICHLAVVDRPSSSVASPHQLQHNRCLGKPKAILELPRHSPKQSSHKQWLSRSSIPNISGSLDWGKAAAMDNSLILVVSAVQMARCSSQTTTVCLSSDKQMDSSRSFPCSSFPYQLVVVKGSL